MKRITSAIQALGKLLKIIAVSKNRLFKSNRKNRLEIEDYENFLI